MSFYAKAMRQISIGNLQLQECFRKHVVHSLSWTLVSAAGNPRDLQRVLKKDACGQHSDVVEHSQPLLPSCTIHTAHGKCDPSKLVLATPEARRLEGGGSEVGRTALTCHRERRICACI
jgi:hypothetical protein